MRNMVSPNNFTEWFDQRKDGIYGDHEHDWGKHHHLQEGEVYVEAGAYWGRYARHASKWVGESGRIILIEPDPLNRKVIEEVVRREKISNVTIVPKAVWCEKTEAKFIIDGNQSGHRLLCVTGTSAPVWRREKKAEKLIEVQCDTVDNILSSLDIYHVDLFACDVENAEVEMMLGMERYLSKKRIKNVAIGAYHRHPEGNYEAVMKILRRHNYKAIKRERGVVYAHA